MSGSRSRRVMLIVAAVTVAATCIGLGIWQLRRLDERRSLNDRILARRAETPVVIEGASTASDLAAPYRRAVARGTYDVDGEVLVYGRSLDGEAGHHVITPLVLADGGAILVVRGWVPFAMRTAPVQAAEPPATHVRVSGWLVPDEGDGATEPDADRVVRQLDVVGIASTLPYEVFALPLRLAAQVPPQPGALPRVVPPPALSEGPHLSYALQWFSFAAVSLAGAAILLRRDRR
jgi:surfeit locus 1 family protein